MIIQAKRITCQSVVRMVSVGFFVSLLPCMTLFAFVISPSNNFSFKMNGESLAGVQRFTALMALSGLAYLVFTLLATMGILLGIWLFSFFRRMEFEFIDADVIAPLTKDPEWRDPRDETTPEENPTPPPYGSLN
jgi:hypothetical protein